MVKKDITHKNTHTKKIPKWFGRFVLLPVTLGFLILLVIIVIWFWKFGDTEDRINIIIGALVGFTIGARGLYRVSAAHFIRKKLSVEFQNDPISTPQELDLDSQESEPVKAEPQSNTQIGSDNLEVIELQDLPEPTPTSRRRTAAIFSRGEAVRKLYRWALYGLMLFVTVWTLSVMDLGDNIKWVYFLIGLQLFISVSALAADITILKMARKSRQGISKGTQFAPSHTLSAQDYLVHERNGSLMLSHGIIPMPLTIPFACWCWLLHFLALNSVLYETVGFVFSLVLVGIYLVTTRGIRYQIQHIHRIKTPPKLLTLRVFDSPWLSQFIWLTDLWRWLGIMVRLEGPQTVGYKRSDRLKLLIGRSGSIVINSKERLLKINRGLKNKKIRNEFYPVLAIQFSNRYWQQGLQDLVDEADVIVMYLAGFNRENLGCVFEIQTLFERVSLHKIVFLVNPKTDLGYLEEVFSSAWQRREQRLTGSTNNPIFKLVMIPLHFGEDHFEFNSFSAYDNYFPKHAKLVAYLHDIAQGSTPSS